MDNAEKTSKGRHHLKMVVRHKYHKTSENDDELFKIPLEGLHSIALQQIGEQEAYIEELEEKIKEQQKEIERKEAKVILTREENRRIAEETRREEVIQGIWQRYLNSQQKNGELKTRCKELTDQICRYAMEIDRLKTRISELEDKEDTI